METSPTIGEIASALNKFQAEVSAVSKDGRNTFRNSRYATLANIWESISPVLTRHGLSLTQHPEGDVALTSLLLHTSGEWLRSTVTMLITEEKREKDKDVYIKTPQTHGIAITYMRRYAMSAILGIVTDDDTDGHPASGPASREQTHDRRPIPDMASAPPSPADKKLSTPAMKKMWGLLRTTKADLPVFRTWMREQFGHESTRDLSPKEVAQVIAYIEAHGPGVFQLDNDDNASAPRAALPSPRDNLQDQIQRAQRIVNQAHKHVKDGDLLAPHIVDLEKVIAEAVPLLSAEAVSDTMLDKKAHLIADLLEGGVVGTAQGGE